MATYWHKHSRGFANDCALYRADTTDQATRLDALGFTRLTREEARRHIRWLNAENAAWGSNRAVGDYSFRALADPTHEEAWKYDTKDYFSALDEEVGY